jgi:hypothetical protein
MRTEQMRDLQRLPHGRLSQPRVGAGSSMVPVCLLMSCVSVTGCTKWFQCHTCLVTLLLQALLVLVNPDLAWCYCITLPAAPPVAKTLREIQEEEARAAAAAAAAAASAAPPAPAGPAAGAGAGAAAAAAANNGSPWVKVAGKGNAAVTPAGPPPAAAPSAWGAAPAATPLSAIMAREAEEAARQKAAAAAALTERVGTGPGPRVATLG